MSAPAPQPKAASRSGGSAPCAPRDAFLRTTRAVADDTRLTVLRTLQQESFGVLELCEIMAIAQPALSHHLRLLHEADLVAKRREGNHIYYRRSPSNGQGLRADLFAAIDALPLDDAIQTRIEGVQASRREQSQAFFEGHASDFASQQAQICDNRVYASIAMDMIDRHCGAQKRALEIGPGDGAMLAQLARTFEQALPIFDGKRHELLRDLRVRFVKIFPFSL